LAELNKPFGVVSTCMEILNVRAWVEGVISLYAGLSNPKD
jgi:hypothetical protein